MKIIITENQYLRLLENQIDLFDDEEEELPISDEFDDEELPMFDEFDDEELPMFDDEEEEFQISDESDEENIPEITYTNALHKPDFNFVFFSGVKGDLPSEGKIKLINVRALNSPREREDDIIIDVNEFTNSKFGYKEGEISIALDIISVYLKGQKLLYLEAKSYCEFYLNRLMMPCILLSSI
jgi:hypothetical protein